MTKRKRGKKSKGGRPSSFRPEMVPQVQQLAFLGATDVQVAEFFGVTDRTVARWKKNVPEFCQALKSGRDDADERVVKSLYRRALGYSHRAVKILAVAQGGNTGSVVEQVPYIERYPPDTTAAIFWLKNRRPDQWRADVVKHEGLDVLADALRAAEARVQSVPLVPPRLALMPVATNGNGNGKH